MNIMKKNGNDFLTLFNKIIFFLIPTSRTRTKFIYKQGFRHVGKALFWQPRKLPSDPEFISIGNNVNIACGVQFINHDICAMTLNKMGKEHFFKDFVGCIEIGDNVMVGANCIILPNVRIGSNVIIGAGAVVTKNIPDNCVVGGVPARVLCSFDSFEKKRKEYNLDKNDIESIWKAFYLQNEEKEKR